MKTIRIIDLLNKIANGEEVPKKIFYANQNWINRYPNDYEGLGYGGCLLNNVCLDNLNDEAEIIEEQKSDMQKLKQDLERATKVFYKAWEPVKEQFAELFGILQKNKLLEEGNQIESIDVEYYKTNDERYNELLEEIASCQEWCIDKINSLEKEQ